MPGIRIRHTDPIVRGCILVVEGGRKPFHIHVDGTGHSVVSTGVWADLELARSQGVEHGFTWEHEVKHPPNLLVGLGTDPEYKPTKQLIERAMRDIAPRGTTVTIQR